MERLTARQQQIFDLIRDSLDETGYPPTRAEIAQKLGFRSPNAAEDHLRALARKGVIEMIPGASRGIRIVETTTLASRLLVRWQPENPYSPNSILKITKKSPPVPFILVLTIFCVCRAKVWLTWA